MRTVRRGVTGTYRLTAGAVILAATCAPPQNQAERQPRSNRFKQSSTATQTEFDAIKAKPLT